MFWLIAAGLVFIVELFAGTFYLLVISASLACAGLAEWLLTTPLTANLLLASVFSVAGILFVRRWQRKHRIPFGSNIADDPDHNQTVMLQEKLPGGLWLVQYRGTQWQAKFDDDTAGRVGKTALIDKKSGNLLLLKNPETGDTTA